MYNFINDPVVVPKQYTGMSSKLVDVIPETFKVDIVRSWDFCGSGGTGGSTNCVMKFINTASGVYNWTVFDKLFQNSSRQIIFTLGQPADYLVSRTAVGSAYLGGKANMVPDDLAAWATAVTAVVSRAKNTFGRTGLIWELWNEIDQSASFGDSISLLGPYTKATVDAIKAVDSTAIIVGASIAGGQTTPSLVIPTYLSTSDGAGKTVYDYLDGIGLHHYVQDVAQISFICNPISYCITFSNFKSILKDAGYDLPIYLTESGILAADTDGGRKYAMRLLTYAALGCKCFIGYQYDGSGYPITAYQSEWNWAANLLKEGAVISSFVPGPSKMKITIDGVEYII